MQVQTRYVTRGGKPQLLVRVYPDELHLDAHEPRLSAAEVAWGKKAWQLAWPATRDKEAERLAWTQLAERFGARRAEWIARKLRPTNLKDAAEDAAGVPGARPAAHRRRPAADDGAAPARPLRRARLPGRRRACCSRRASRFPATLPVGPTFDDAPLADPAPGGLTLDAGMRWLVDFAEAEKVGMGIRVALTPELAAGTLDTLLVLGVNAKLAPDAGSAALEAVLDAQRYTRGLAFVAPGTATNNTAEGGTGFSRRDRTAGPSFESVPVAAKAGSAAAVAARLLGIRPATLAGLDGARPHGRARRAPPPDGALAAHRRLLPRPDHGLARGPARDVHRRAARRRAPLLRRLRPRARPRADAPRRPPAVRRAAR